MLAGKRPLTVAMIPALNRHLVRDDGGGEVGSAGRRPGAAHRPHRQECARCDQPVPTRVRRAPDDCRRSRPGSAPPADTVYKVTQILAWLAGQTCEVAGRIEKRSQVVALVRRLAHA
jgi:hypothetical protein